MRILAMLFICAFAHAQSDVSSTRSYKDVLQFIQKVAKNNPQNASLFTMGYSDYGVAIDGIKIGSGPVSHLVVAAHHGNEMPSTEVALNFAESIAKDPIPGQTIYVIPVLNIEGYNARRRYEMVNNVKLDLNRDYPGPCGTDGPFNSKSTKALADFVANNNFVAAATIHTYKPAVVYPWGNYAQTYDTPYNDLFETIAKAATIASRYPIGFSSEIMYPADGTFEDYVYWKHGVYSLLFEVGESNRPSMDVLRESVRTNVIGLRAMFEASPKVAALHHEFTNGCSQNKGLDLHLE